MTLTAAILRMGRPKVVTPSPRTRQAPNLNPMIRDQMTPKKRILNKTTLKKRILKKPNLQRMISMKANPNPTTLSRMFLKKTILGIKMKPIQRTAPLKIRLLARASTTRLRMKTPKALYLRLTLKRVILGLTEEDLWTTFLRMRGLGEMLRTKILGMKRSKMAARSILVTRGPTMSIEFALLARSSTFLVGHSASHCDSKPCSLVVLFER